MALLWYILTLFLEANVEKVESEVMLISFKSLFKNLHKKGVPFCKTN